MTNNPDYKYHEQWKRKPRFGWKQVLYSAAILLALVTIINVLPKIRGGRSSVPTPTTAYIEYGSRRLPSVIPQEVEFPAPALVLTDLEGATVSLADHQDKVVLVNMWATWCPGCEAEMPELQAFSETYQDNGLLVIGVNAEETADQLQPFLEKLGLTFPIWLDSKKDVYRVFNSNHLPSSYVIDRLGTVRLAWYGPISKEVLEIYVAPLIQE